MDRFKNIFKSSGSTGHQQSPTHRNGAAVTAQNNGASSVNGQAERQGQSDAEGFLCPTCMQSFSSPDQLQQHFTTVHADPVQQVPADKELELLRMQLTASEESRSLLSSELMNMQRQMQEMAMNKPDLPPDQSGEVKRLETQIQILQIENTELAEKTQLADSSVQQFQGRLSAATEEQKTLTSTVNTEREKYRLVAEQLSQEKQRNSAAQEEARQLSEQLRKSEVAVEQMRSAAGKADEAVAKLTGKEELCRNLEQQINEYKQNTIKHESEAAQLKKTLESQEETIRRSSAMHSEMKTAMDSKIQSMEALIQEKATSLDRALGESEQLQHKVQTLEARLADNQTELTEANKKYDDLHQNFVQRIDAGEGTNVIVTQLKEDNARTQEKLKHSDEKLQAEKEESYQKLKTLEGSQKQLEQKLSSAVLQNDELKADITRFEEAALGRQSEVEQQLSSLKLEHSTSITELQSTISSQETAILTLDDQLSSAQQQVSDLTENLQTTADELTSLQSTLSDSQRAVSDLGTEKAELTLKLSDKMAELSAFTDSNVTLTQSLLDKSTELQDVQSQLTDVTQKMDESTSEHTKLLTAFQKLTADSEQRATDLNTKIAGLESELESSEFQVSTANERIINLETDLKSSEDLLQEKLSALEQLQNDSAELNEQILAIKEELGNADTGKSRTESENVSLQSLVTSLQTEKLGLCRETERLQEQSTGHSTQFTVVSEELDRCKQVVLERDASIMVLQQQLDTQMKEGESLQGSLLVQIDQMQSAVKQADATKQAELTKLGRELEECRTKIKKQSETNAALAKEHAAVIENLNVAEAQVISLQKSQDDSKSEAESLLQQLEKQAENHGHVLQETTDILQRTADENESLSRALTELKAERFLVEEQLHNAQKNSDDWQSKHRLLQDDIEAIRLALSQEKTTSEETKQLLISHKLQMQSKHETLEEDKIKLKRELEEAMAAVKAAEEKATDNLQTLEEALLVEKSKMEESEAKFNMQLVSLTENLSLNKTDLTATQEKLMDVVKHNDELRGLNIELETKLEASNDERSMLWNRCMSSESETKALRDEKEDLRLQIENLNSALHELGRENQSLQIKTTKAQTRRWVEDDDALDCTNCAKSFNVMIRKHHCRNCGNIFCHDCSSKQLMLPVSSKPSRVCDNCHVELSR